MSIDIIVFWVNILLELASVVFITFVFFDLVFVDRNLKLSGISEKFEKFKRYDVFKSSLIYLVLYIYFSFFAKLSMHLSFPTVAFTVFTSISNVSLLLFTVKLYSLVHNYIPKEASD